MVSVNYDNGTKEEENVEEDEVLEDPYDRMIGMVITNMKKEVERTIILLTKLEEAVWRLEQEDISLFF